MGSGIDFVREGLVRKGGPVYGQCSGSDGGGAGTFAKFGGGKKLEAVAARTSALTASPFWAIETSLIAT